MPKKLLKNRQPARILNMKSMRLNILILSILLLTFSSCLLFYKNIFMIDTLESVEKIDFEEFRTLDLKIKSSALMMRKNLSVDSKDLETNVNQLKELLYIINDINKNNPELRSSIKNMQAYFENKSQTLIKFKGAISDLGNSLQFLKTDYNQLSKTNDKFLIEKKDFYHQCFTDALLYLSISSKENEIKLFEDINTLDKTIKDSKTPILFLKDFNNHLGIIYHRLFELNNILEVFIVDFTFNEDLAVIAHNYDKIRLAKLHNEEIIIELLYTIIVCYLIVLIVILRKRH